MQYKSSKVLENIDILEVTREEYDRLNSCYREAIRHHSPHLYESGQIGDISQAILTDGVIRAPVYIQIAGDKDAFKSDAITNSVSHSSLTFPVTGYVKDKPLPSTTTTNTPKNNTTTTTTT